MPVPVGVSSTAIRVEPFQTIKELNPVLYYRLNDTASPAVNIGSLGTGKNLTATNVTHNTGKVPTKSPVNGATFNGTTAFMTRADGFIGTGNISATNPVFSCGAWIKTSSTGTQHIFQQQDGNNNNSGFRLFVSGGSVWVEGKFTTGVNDFYTAGNLTAIDSGVAALVGVTVSSNRVDIYANGVWIGGAFRLGGGTYSTTADIFVGRDYDTTDYFNGVISDIFVTEQVMTHDDWYKVYRNGLNWGTSPSCDNFLDAYSIDPTGEVVVTDITNASIEPGEFDTDNPGTLLDDYSNKTIWMKLVPTGASLYTVSSTGVDHAADLYSVADGMDTAIENLTPLSADLGFSTTDLSFAAQIGTTYYMRFSSYFDSAGTLTTTVTEIPIVATTIEDTDWTTGSIPTGWTKYGSGTAAYSASGTTTTGGSNNIWFERTSGITPLGMASVTQLACIDVNATNNQSWIDLYIYGDNGTGSEIDLDFDTDHDYWSCDQDPANSYPITPTGLIVTGLTYDFSTGQMITYWFDDSGVQVKTGTVACSPSVQSYLEYYIRDFAGTDIFLRNTYLRANEILDQTAVTAKAISWGWVAP